MYLEPCTLQEWVAWSHFQYFLYCRTSRFMFASWMVIINLPTLKYLLIRPLAYMLFWEFQISSYMMYQDRWWWTLFYFIFSLYFIFLFLEQLGLGVISHAVTSVTNWWRSHKTDHGARENEVEGSETKWRHTAWTTHAGLMLYSWSFRVGCTVVSMDHEE